ncbi:hypothetical protein LIER_02916 [Lithospermum erythrorhizon]|uniref:NAC domain-containing protein n=1 Tax=Lithospermum erythrorhizon TaxID=34254 RepID=A0AAV3NSP8_LITER
MSYLPIGFRFMPTAEEILCILKTKILNEEPSWSGIQEINLYGVESPWVLFNDNYAWESFHDNDGSSSTSSKKKKKQVLYCFTRLTRAGRNGSKNIVRLCGCGNWHGETSEKRSCDDRLIMKMFKFKIKSRDGLVLDEDVEKYSWLMHEYSLSKKSLEELNLECSDYVICKITRQEEKRGSRKQDYGNGCKVPEVVDNVVFQGLHEILGGYLGKRKSPDNDDDVIMEQHQSKVARLDEPQDSTKLQSDDELEAEKFSLELEDMLIDDAKEENPCQEQVQENSRMRMENESANNQEQPRESMLDDVIDWEAFNKIPIPDDIFQDFLLGGLEEGPTSLPDCYNFSNFFQFDADVKG